MYFYDTCSLLNELDDAFHEPFYVSSITLEELEHIKTSMSKDSDVKYKARRLTKLLAENEDKYTVVFLTAEEEYELCEKSEITVNNDLRIVQCAKKIHEKDSECTFITHDISLYNICKHFYPELPTCYAKPQLTEDYCGYKILELNEDEQSAFYTNYNYCGNIYNLLNNEYLLLKDKSSGQIIDTYKYTDKNGYTPLKYRDIRSSEFGMLKPKDKYQALAIDSLHNNQITMLRGHAGTGKTLLALGYLFQELEAHHIDRIIIFCNTVATAGSAKLGLIKG